MTRADAVAESLLEQGITAMKIWPFDPAALANEGVSITPEQLKAAIAPFEKIRRAVGDKMEIMVEFHSLWNLPMAKKLARWLEPYEPTWYERPHSHELAAGPRRAGPVDECLDLRQRDARQPLPLQGHARPRRDERRDGRSLLDPAG